MRQPKILLDTNILVYFYDNRDPAKHQFAQDLLTDLGASQSAALSTQCLAEFAYVAQRKLRFPPKNIYEQIHVISNSWQILPLTNPVVLEAARGVRDYQLAYYDAQIWATARLNQIPAIFSEDFNSGSVLEGIHFVNPFLPTFQLADWV